MRYSEVLNRILSGGDLDEQTACDVMTAIMGGELTEAQIAGFLVAMRMKQETVDEIVGCARAMREAATRLDLGEMDLVDTCGTGGDRAGTFNVSTAAALIAAGAGVRVAKHGNRSVSSHSGSADVLETLGVRIDAAPPTVARCIREAGMGFLFAPVFHKAMKHAIGPRRQLGVRTVFNVLGPLTNPAGATRQVIGLFAPGMVETIAQAIGRLGTRRAWVLHSDDGLDEISIAAPTRVAAVEDGAVRTFTVEPGALGLNADGAGRIGVSSAEESARLLESVLAGQEGQALDIALVNAAAAIVVGGAAGGLSEALELARESVRSGRAAAVLEKLVAVSNETD
jgi:anthranilate phosphoribosyltransferase